MKKTKGNPYKRGNKWEFYFYTYSYDENGKKQRKQHRKSADTKEEAVKLLKEYRAKAELDLLPLESNDTLGAYIPKWFAVHKKKLQPNTINGYNTNINNHILPALANVQLRKLKPEQLENFYDILMNEKHLSAKSVLYVHNVLKTALKAAVNEGLIAENPCMRAKPPKVPKYKAQKLSQEQMQKLIKYLHGNRYETEIRLAMELGLRRGEVLGLMNNDIDEERHTISIERQVSTVKDTTKTNNNGYYGLKCLKSESSERVMYISANMMNIIKAKQAFNELQKQKLGEMYNDLGLICCADDGNVLSPQTLYHAFKRALRECGLPDIRFHDLRHSYAVLCIDLDVPVKVLSQALGHSSTAVTDAVYADSIERKRQLADLINNAINPI